MFCTIIYVVFIIDRTRKQTLLIKWVNFVFTKDLPSLSQSNIQAVKAEKEEWYTLSSMIYIKLKNCCFFFFEAYFEPPKIYTNQLSNICNEVATELNICSFTKNMSLYFFSDLFCSYLSRYFRIFTNLCFPENLLVAAVNRFKVLKTFISLKVTVYIQNCRLRSEKALDA